MDLWGYYSIFGLSEKATEEEIKRAYMNLALKYHPDRSKSPLSHSMMVKINAAYEVLSDTDKRRLYDNVEVSINDHNIKITVMFIIPTIAIMLTYLVIIVLLQLIINIVVLDHIFRNYLI